MHEGLGHGVFNAKRDLVRIEVKQKTPWWGFLSADRVPACYKSSLFLLVKSSKH